MGIEDLEMIEVVKLFWVRELQKVTEDDSPAPGATFDIAQKDSLYEYFHSRQEAQKYINSLRAQYRSQNLSLKLKDDRLIGSVDHDFSHYFEIDHRIEHGRFSFLELPKGVEALLENPRRRIIKDEIRHVPGGVILNEANKIVRSSGNNPAYKFTLF